MTLCIRDISLLQSFASFSNFPCVWNTCLKWLFSFFSFGDVQRGRHICTGFLHRTYDPGGFKPFNSVTACVLACSWANDATSFRRSNGLAMLTWQDKFSLLAFPDGISTPLKASNATRGPCPRWSLIRGCRSNRAIEEHTSSEKWWSSIRRFLSDPKGISCRWLNSMGTSLGRRPALAGFVVDQAIVWAEPHATRFVCLPLKRKHRRHQHRIKISVF